jgi:hypothetical protein
VSVQVADELPEGRQLWLRWHQAIGFTELVNLPYWDLYAALRPVFNIAEWADAWHALGRIDITEASMRDRHSRFAAQAFEKLRAP